MFVNLRRKAMSRKFSLIIVGALIFAGYVTSFGQTAPVNGTVELKKADGTREPVANALIEVYRTDIKSGFPSAKTNKKGEFSFAGIPFGGKYAFAVSAPGCSPTIFPDVKAGQERLVITMSPGDGGKLSEDDVRKGAAAKAPVAGNGTAPPQQTAEEKKAAAEFEKKNAEITEKNKKTQAGDETARKSNEEGNAALKAENWDLAISKFTEGIAAVPDYVGSTPILLNGKVVALKAKAFRIYREGATQADADVRKNKYQEANGFYDQALAAFDDAIAVIKKAEAASTPAEQKQRDTLTTDLYAAATEIHRLKAVSGVDATKSADADKVVTAYIALEADPVKKLNAQIALGDIMRLTGNFPRAVEVYKAVLVGKPDQAEAMAGLGLCLFAQGAAASPEDKEKEQEGLNYMQKYTEIAPVAATDSQAVKELKQSVKETVDYLKSLKMAPQKVTTTPKKKP